MTTEKLGAFTKQVKVCFQMMERLTRSNPATLYVLVTVLRTGDFKGKPRWDSAHWVPWQQGHCSRAQGSATLWSDLFPPHKGMSSQSYAALTPHPSNVLLFNCKMQHMKIFLYGAFMLSIQFMFLKYFRRMKLVELFFAVFHSTAKEEERHRYGLSRFGI